LTAIASHIIGGNNYIFSYDTQQLMSPFDNSKNLGSVDVLAGVQIASTLKYLFEYNKNGELIQVRIPTGGSLNWSYGAYDFFQGRQVREVIRRSIALSDQDSGAAYLIDRGNRDSTVILHSSVVLRAFDNSGEQAWSFCTDVQSSYLGLATSYEERDQIRQSVLRRTDYT
jgi:hypothetical protein